MGGRVRVGRQVDLVGRVQVGEVGGDDPRQVRAVEADGDEERLLPAERGRRHGPQRRDGVRRDLLVLQHKTRCCEEQEAVHKFTLCGTSSTHYLAWGTKFGQHDPLQRIESMARLLPWRIEKENIFGPC